MGTRFVPDYETYVSLLAAGQQRTSTLLTQISSGQRLTAPSDDPVAAAQLLANQNLLAQNDQFTRSVQGLQSELQTADSALSTVVNALTQTIALGTAGANGTLSNNERQAIANQVDTIQQQILAAANSDYQGNYLFAGTATGKAPYVVDATSPSGVTYIGNPQTNQVEASPGQLLTVNKPGSSIFGTAAGGTDVFQALADLSKALRANVNVTGATAEVQQAFSNVNLQRTFYGNTLSTLNTDANSLTQQNIYLTQQQTALDGVDMAKAATQLSQSQVMLQAAYAAFSKVSQNNLFSFLK